MEKLLIEGDTTHGHGIIMAVQGNCTVKGCTGIALCPRCKRLNDIIGCREEVPMSDLFENVEDVENVKSYI